jgi:hypothetical protein
MSVWNLVTGIFLLVAFTITLHYEAVADNVAFMAVKYVGG